ncbi:antirestriction protein, partial [Escherichia coli]
PAVWVRLVLPWPRAPPRFSPVFLWRHGTARCRRTCDYGGFGNVCCCTCCIRWNLAQIQLWKHRRTLV